MAELAVEFSMYMLETEMGIFQSLLSSVSRNDRPEFFNQVRILLELRIGSCRELAYDMEYWIRLFNLCIMYGVGGDSSSSTFSSSFFGSFRVRSDIAHTLRDLAGRFNALQELLDPSILIRPQPIHDLRPTKLHHVNTECLVGLDAAMDEVARMVTGAGDEAQRKIVSIVGMAGSGKTTLAATVYQRLGEQNGFQYRVFVSIGPEPDFCGILQEILSQLRGGHNGSEDIDQLAEAEGLSGLLWEKRYLIVVDDLWSSRDWGTIKNCFPENNLGSRIITTTRNYELASECSSGSNDYIYKIGLLSDADSERLFLKQLGTTGHACPQYWNDVSGQIMRRCGGLPLALVSVASMLAHEPSRDEIERLGLNLLSSSHMDGMKQILNLSYNYNLSGYSKLCLLYMSIFPENYEVEVERLFRLWVVAEGFILGDGKSHLDDLISKNMVQRLHRKNNHGGASTRYCRLHPVIRDFIVCKSKEENFVTPVDAQHQHEPIHQRPIRRVSIQSSDKQGEALARNVTMDLSRAMSVTVFGQASAIPRLTDLSLFVRVLDLGGCKGPVCLEGLVNLRNLRYLSLRGTDVSELPEKIKVLKFLQLLDVGFTKVKKLPSTIDRLKNLRYLSLRGTDVRELPETIKKLRGLRTLDVKSTKVTTQLPGSIDLLIETGIRVPVAIQHCKDLEKLVTVDLSDQPPRFVESLGHLQVLRVIALTWSFHQSSDEAYRKALVSSISSWRYLTSLTIHCGLGCSMEFLGSSLSKLPEKLEKFKVTAGRFASVPKWISKLKNLSFLQITVCKQGTEQLKILGDLPQLRRLRLGLDFITEKPIVIESGWFQKLESFSVDCPMPWLSFSTGSMQKLTYLQLKLCACPTSQTSVPSGICNLQSIKEVSLCYNKLEERSPNIRMIVAAIRQSVTEHPNRIDVFINDVKDYSAQAAEDRADAAAGTGNDGTDFGKRDDIQRTDEEPVNTRKVQSTTEITEIESDSYLQRQGTVV